MEQRLVSFPVSKFCPILPISFLFVFSWSPSQFPFFFLFFFPLSLSLPIRSWKNGKKHSSLIFPLLFLLLICFPPLWRLCSKLSDVRSPSGEQVWHVGRTEGNVTAMSRRDELISPFPFCSLSKTAHLYYSSHPLLATAELPPVFDRPVLIISKQSLFKFLKNLYQNSWLLSAFSPRWWKLSPWFVLF